FPEYPPVLEKKVWETQEKKSKLEDLAGIGKELEDLKKEYCKIGTDAFDGLDKIKSPEALAKRRIEVAQELKKLPTFRKSLTDLDTLANKKLTELKKAKADAAAIKLLQKIQNAVTDLVEASKSLVNDVKEELDEIERSLTGKPAKHEEGEEQDEKVAKEK